MIFTAELTPTSCPFICICHPACFQWTQLNIRYDVHWETQVFFPSDSNGGKFPKKADFFVDLALNEYAKLLKNNRRSRIREQNSLYGKRYHKIGENRSTLVVIHMWCYHTMTHPVQEILLQTCLMTSSLDNAKNYGNSESICCCCSFETNPLFSISHFSQIPHISRWGIVFIITPLIFWLGISCFWHVKFQSGV